MNYCVENDDEPSSSSAVRRFERYADGAGEFIGLVELGGTPRRYMFFDPLIRHLLAGKELNYEVSRGTQHHCFGIRPICFEERGVEAKLCYDHQDHKVLEKNLPRVHATSFRKYIYSWGCTHLPAAGYTALQVYR